MISIRFQLKSFNVPWNPLWHLEPSKSPWEPRLKSCVHWSLAELALTSANPPIWRALSYSRSLWTATAAVSQSITRISFHTFLSVEACRSLLVAFFKELGQTVVAGTAFQGSLVPEGEEGIAVSLWVLCQLWNITAPKKEISHILLSLHGVGTPGCKPLSSFCWNLENC